MKRNYQSQFNLETEARNFMAYALSLYAKVDTITDTYHKARIEKRANSYAKIAVSKFNMAEFHRSGVIIY